MLQGPHRRQHGPYSNLQMQALVCEQRFPMETLVKSAAMQAFVSLGRHALLGPVLPCDAGTETIPLLHLLNLRNPGAVRDVSLVHQADPERATVQGLQD